MDNKAKYEVFCTKTYVPIYSKPWWLDAVAGPENWGVYIVEKKGILCAAMPYFLTKRNGYKLITKATHTQNNGIIFNYPPNQKQCARRGFEEACIEEICDFIENMGIALYEQQYHYSFTNWLPFFWRGYHEITRYTYVIDTSKTEQEIVENYAAKLRNHLKKAQKIVHLAEKEISIEDFFRINRMSFTRQGRDIPYSQELVQRLYNACKQHNACKILSAEDEQGNVHSVAMLVWDERSVYYLINGTDPQYKNSQANDFLIHEGIKFAKEKGLLFDFEGSVLRPIERAFREFGGEAMPYFRIRKVFDPDIIRAEAEQAVRLLEAEKAENPDKVRGGGNPIQ